MSQGSELPGNAAQIEYWNAAAGDTWARLQELLDRQIAPLGHEALRARGVATQRSHRLAWSPRCDSPTDDAARKCDGDRFCP